MLLGSTSILKTLEIATVLVLSTISQHRTHADIASVDISMGTVSWSHQCVLVSRFYLILALVVQRDSGMTYVTYAMFCCLNGLFFVYEFTYKLVETSVFNKALN